MQTQLRVRIQVAERVLSKRTGLEHVAGIDETGILVGYVSGTAVDVVGRHTVVGFRPDGLEKVERCSGKPWQRYS